MSIGILKPSAGEKRVTMLPGEVAKLCGLGATVAVEAGLGEALAVSDKAYEDAGARIEGRKKLLSESAWLLRLDAPDKSDVGRLAKDCVQVGFLDPFNNRSLISQLAQQGVSAISMEMIPRTTIAQKMDALSSQANLGGYSAVIVAAERLNKALPMMMTAAGTISPARVFVIGVGVAGLQAIATAKRLGARVEAFDTRPVVAEQVQSLGAKFVKIDLGETGQTEQGYAQALTPEQIKLQQAGMAKVCAQSDIVITTAQVFGRTAPVLVTEEMVAGMQAGSVIVDMAVATGGNVEGSVPGKEVIKNGVRIIGVSNLPGEVAYHASQMYGSNLVNLLEHFWDSESNSLKLDLADEIAAGCVLTHGGEVIHPRLKEESVA